MKNEKFAIIKIGGAQHMVKVGDTIDINRIEEDQEKSFDITDVLLIQDGEDVKVGTPLVEKAKVSAKVVEHFRGKKVVSNTFKAKSRYRRKVGRRQELTKIEITKIS